MRSILFVTRHTPLPWEDGAGAYLHDLARYLANRGFRVDVLWLQPHQHLRWKKVWRLPSAWDAAVRLHLPGAIRLGRRFVFPAVVWEPLQANTQGRIRRGLSAIGIDLPRRRRGANPLAGTAVKKAGWMSPPSAAERILAQEFVEQIRPDAVIASYAWMCPLFDLPALRGIQRVCLAHDVGWKRAALSAPASGSVAPEMTREDEAGWLQRAEIVISISESDAGEIGALAPDSRVIVAPKALEPRARFADANSQRIVFVGSDNAFNAEGLEWFLRGAWPQIRRDVPGATLDVCGTINRSVKLRPDGVEFHGTVSRLDFYYEQAALAIVPLLRATGLNIKLVEAAAFGRAIVATPNTLVGAPFLRDALVEAGTADEFASAVKHLLLDSDARVAAASRVFAAVHARLEPPVCYGPLASLLGERPEAEVAPAETASLA